MNTISDLGLGPWYYIFAYWLLESPALPLSFYLHEKALFLKNECQLFVHLIFCHLKIKHLSTKGNETLSGEYCLRGTLREGIVTDFNGTLWL